MLAKGAEVVLLGTLVSAVITTYGRKFEEIRPSVDSVVRQTYGNIELIIVDDNGLGTQNQKQVELGLNLYLENGENGKVKISYFPNSENSGAQVSRNNGIANSSGEYVAFLDDDDLWFETKIEQQIKCFNDHEGENVGLVFCKGYLRKTDESGNEKDKPYNMSSAFVDTLTFADMSYGDYIGSTSQVLIKKSVFDVCGLFDLNQPARQDYEMWIRISEAYLLKGVPEYLFVHVQHSGEQITKSPKKAAAGIYNIYKKYHAKCSFNAKWHLLWLSFSAHKKAGSYLNAISCFVRMAFYLCLAVTVDRKNFVYCIKTHNSR